MATVLVQSGVAMPMALLKFLPEVAHSAGPRGSRRLLRDALTVRMLLLGLALGLMNLYAGSVADLLELGPSGSTWLRLISAIALARAAVDMMTRALNAFFAQKWSNIIALVQVILELSFVGIALALGYEMNGLLGGLLGAALAVALLSVGIVSWQFRHVELPVSADATEPDRARRWFSGEGPRFFRFSLVTYLFGFSAYFTTLDFAAPALVIVLSTEDVAVFATAYRALVWLRVPSLLTAPLFLVVATWGGLFAAAVVFGGARLVLALLAYAFTRQEYGFRFPWAFARQIGVVSVLMMSSSLRGGPYGQHRLPRSPR